MRRPVDGLSDPLGSDQWAIHVPLGKLETERWCRWTSSSAKRSIVSASCVPRMQQARAAFYWPVLAAAIR